MQDIFSITHGTSSVKKNKIFANPILPRYNLTKIEKNKNTSKSYKIKYTLYPTKSRRTIDFAKKIALCQPEPKSKNRRGKNASKSPFTKKNRI